MRGLSAVLQGAPAAARPRHPLPFFLLPGLLFGLLFGSDLPAAETPEQEVVHHFSVSRRFAGRTLEWKAVLRATFLERAGGKAEAPASEAASGDLPEPGPFCKALRLHLEPQRPGMGYDARLHFTFDPATLLPRTQGLVLLGPDLAFSERLDPAERGMRLLSLPLEGPADTADLGSDPVLFEESLFGIAHHLPLRDGYQKTIRLLPARLTFRQGRRPVIARLRVERHAAPVRDVPVWKVVVAWEKKGKSELFVDARPPHGVVSGFLSDGSVWNRVLKDIRP